MDTTPIPLVNPGHRDCIPIVSVTGFPLRTARGAEVLRGTEHVSILIVCAALNLPKWMQPTALAGE